MAAAKRTALAFKIKTVFVKAIFIIHFAYNSIIKKFNKLTFLADNFFMSRKSRKQSPVIPIIVIFSVILIISASLVTRAVINKKLRDRTVKVAFFGLSDDLCKLIESKTPLLEEVKFTFDIIPEKGLELSILKDKYDVLFTWKGSVTSALSTAAQTIPDKVLVSAPTSLRDKKAMPILLDHYEMTFSKSVATALDYNIGSNLPTFINYLESSKKKVFSPFFANGGEDRTLLALVGSLVEAYGGVEAYKVFINEIKKNQDFETLLDAPLNAKGLTLRKVMIQLKSFSEQGLAHPQWFAGRKNDLVYFAQDNQIGAFFTSLSVHRTIPYNIIKNFESSYFPFVDYSVPHGILAPAVTCVLLSDNSNGEKYLQNLMSVEVQEDLSNATMLAPVHYRAQAYDRQADDVRYWAASCAGGALPDPALAAFQTNNNAIGVLASDIREFLRQR